MFSTRIAKAVAFKASALGTSFVNVVFAATILQPEDSLLYLAMLSLIQIMLPFAGLGMSQRLVKLSPEEALALRVWPWFVASVVIGFTVLVAQAWVAETPNRWLWLGICTVLLSLMMVAEWLRTGYQRVSALFLFNSAIFGIAVIVLGAGGISTWLLAPPVAALCVALFMGRDVIAACSTNSLMPRLVDLTTAFRVTSISQYYSIIIVMVSLLVNSPLILALVLVWRFTVFYNWQTFYWVRFGHKQMVGGLTPERWRENRKVIRLNFLAAGGTLLVVGSIYLFGLQGHLEGTALDTTFFRLLCFYAVLRVTMNLIFPYEVFTLYNKRPGDDLSFLAMATICFVVIGVLVVTVQNGIVIILGIEAIWMLWRFDARRRLRLWERTQGERIGGTP